MTNGEKIKGLYSLKECLVENPIELEGHKSLPITLIDYAIQALEQAPTVYAVPISVIDEIKAEINYVGAHSDYGMQCVFAQAIAIIDKHMERSQNDLQ